MTKSEENAKIHKLTTSNKLVIALYIAHVNQHASSSLPSLLTTGHPHAKWYSEAYLRQFDFIWHWKLYLLPHKNKLWLRISTNSKQKFWFDTGISTWRY